MAMSDEADLYMASAFDPGGTTGGAVIATYPEVMGPPPFRRWMWESRGMLPEALKLLEGPDAVEADRLKWKEEVAEAGRFKLLDNIAWWHAEQYSGGEDCQVDLLVQAVSGWNGPATPIVMESFKLRTYRMDDELLSPVRVAAKAEYAIRRLAISGREAEHVQRRLVWQQPSLAMGVCSDERLQVWWDGKFYNGTRGAPHARDAVRHALTFLRREKEARSRGKTVERWPWEACLTPPAPRGGTR